MYHHQRSGGPPTGASPAPQSSGGPSALPAFSHPHSGIRTPPNGQSPHVSPYATPAPLYAPALPYSYPTIPSSMSRQSSVGAGAWSPAPPPPPPGGGQRATTSAAKYEGGSNEYDDDEEEDEEDDDDEDDDDEDEDEDDSAMSPGTRKRKRDSDGQARGGGGGGAGSDASPHASVSTYAQSPAAGTSANDSTGASAHKKPKPPRGSKACTHCRKLKMRCTGGENGPPCDRCRHSGYQCIFEESNRGKKAAANAAAAAQAKAEKAAQAALAASKAKGAAGATGGSGQTTQENESLSSGFPTKTKGKGKQSNQDLARSLEKMEQTLESVLRTIRDPAHASSLGHASGMLTRPPSPESGGRGGADHHHKDAAAQQHHRHLDGGRPTSIAPSQLTAPTSHFTQMHQPNSARYASVASAATAGAPMSPPRQRSVRMAATGSSGGAGRDGEGSRSHRPTSPRLHSLPPDSLNPLGLLAEASLGNQMGSVRRSKSTNVVAVAGAADGPASAEAEGDDEGGSSTREASATSSSQRAGKTAGFTDQSTANKDGSTTGRTSSTSNRPRSITGNGPALGVASKTYFRPGPMSMLPLRKVIIDRELPPELLTSGVVSDTEVLDLFSIFFHNCAQHIILLDPEWHTPQFVCGRSPFLFTVILAIASRYYARRPDLHGQCLRQATKEAFNCLERGFKSVEIVQAFLLLTMWGQPARRFEEDKSWIFAGIAFRVATDLNLHRKSMATLPGQGNLDDPAMMEREKEIRNRERTWIFCFVVDRSLSSQFGKPSVIREDFILRNTRSWALSPTAQPADMALSAIVGLQRLTSRQTDLLYSSVTSVTGLNQDLDFSSMIRIFSEQLEEWRQFWTIRGLVIGDCRNRQPEIPPNDGTLSPREIELRQLFAVANRDTPPPEDGDHTIRTLYYLIQQAPLRFHYAALTLHSFGLQFGNQIDDRGVQFIRCYDSAKGIFFAARDGMRPILRYASDTQILIIAFSLVFMLKLTRPTFSRYADTEEILRLVEEGADMLEEVAASPLHTPALYGHFLRATLAQARADMAARAAGGGAGAATNGYPSRAGSPTPGGNGNAGDDGPSVAAAFGLPQDPALGGGGNGGSGGDPSLAPMPTGTTRHNSISDAAMAQAFAAAAGGNVNQFQQQQGQQHVGMGMGMGGGNGFPYPGFSAAPLPSSNAMGGGGGGAYGANNAFNPLAFLSTPTLGGSGNGAFGGGGPTSTMTSQPSGSAAGPSAGATAQYGGGNGGQPDASSLLLDNVWWNQLVPAGLGGPLDGLNGGIDLLQHEAEHGVLGGGGAGGGGGAAGQGDGGSGEGGQTDAQHNEEGEATPTKQQRRSEGAEGQEGGASAKEGAAGGDDSMRTRSAPVEDGSASASANAATDSQDDPDAQPRTRSSSTTTTTAAMGKGFGAGTGVTRPSSPSNANAAAGAGAGGAGVLNQFAGSFLTFDFS